jgi:hypothetical protein
MLHMLRCCIAQKYDLDKSPAIFSVYRVIKKVCVYLMITVQKTHNSILNSFDHLP